MSKAFRLTAAATAALLMPSEACLPAADKAKPELARLKIKLPKPMFVGTPRNIRSSNLEKPRGSRRRGEFLAPKGTRNVAAGKPVSSSDEEPIIGELELITDGDKEGGDGCYVELGQGRQHVQIDLEAEYKIYAVLLWHYHQQARVYRDVVVQACNEPDFIVDVRTLFNNDHDNSSGLGVGKEKEYIETYEGRLVDAKGLKARYVRLYSKGSTASDQNHYIEVAVYGKPTP